MPATGGLAAARTKREEQAIEKESQASPLIARANASNFL